MRTIINNSLFCLLAIVAATLCGCSDSIFEDEAQNDGGSIRLAADIEQLAVMRVNDCGFCDGDMMGVYVVDYEGGNPGTLKLKGNRGDNVRYTFDEAANKWTGAYELYWKDGHTPVDVYGYYPFAAPESIEDYQFEVQKDQSKASSSDEMGGYEASDFLWGKVDEVAPTSSVIRLPLSHRMSNARVTLLQGSGFTAEEWGGHGEDRACAKRSAQGKHQPGQRHGEQGGRGGAHGHPALMRRQRVARHRGATDCAPGRGALQHHHRRHAV